MKQWIYGALALVCWAMLVPSCGKVNEPEPNKPENTQAESNDGFDKGYRCVLEISADMPYEVRFDLCTWSGALKKDGKPYSKSPGVFQSFGSVILDKPYRGEFESNLAGFLTINFRLYPTEAMGKVERIKFRYHYTYYLEGKVVKQEEHDEDAEVLGILGATNMFQVASPFNPF